MLFCLPFQSIDGFILSETSVKDKPMCQKNYEVAGDICGRLEWEQYNERKKSPVDSRNTSLGHTTNTIRVAGLCPAKVTDRHGSPLHPAGNWVPGIRTI